MLPITGSHSLLASSHSPHPSAPLAVCLPDHVVAGQASGRDCHVPRVASIPRLGFVSPPAVCGTASPHPTVMTDCIAVLAEANNCRRPVHCDEGSGDDSHVLAMRVGSLASAHPCNSDTWSSPSPDNTLLRARHCQSGFTPQGWPLTHADLMNWQVHARLGTSYTSEVEQCDSELFAPCLVQHPPTSHDGE